MDSEEHVTPEDQILEDQPPPTKAAPWNYRIKYNVVVMFIYFHAAGLYGIYKLFSGSIKWQTMVFSYLLFFYAMVGIIAAAHRLWAHRSYKATLPLQIFYMIAHCVASQHTVAYWVKDHRLHHKFSDTDADPYNASRGFFFSHIGWVLVKKHPEVQKRGRLLDISDIKNNPVLAFQERNARWLIPTVAFILPSTIPLLWGETFSNAWHLNIFRYLVNLHITFIINSVAHIWGYKPYDKTIAPTQSIPVLMLTMGEGFHNYHHVFPWDYKGGEMGNNCINIMKNFIDICAWLGLAYDLKTAPEEMVTARSARTGDGSNLWCSKAVKE